MRVLPYSIRFTAATLVSVSYLCGVPRAEVRYTVTLLESHREQGVSSTQARAISESGNISGVIYSAEAPERAFSFSPASGFVILPDVPGLRAKPGGINDLGQIVGGLWTVYDGIESETAFIYTPGEGYRYLPDLGSTNQHLATAINNSSVIAGTAGYSGEHYHAFRYSDATGIQDLGTLGGTQSIAKGINESGTVTGSAQDSNGVYHAFLYNDQTGMIDLGVGFAGGINNLGVVAGWTSYGAPALFRDGQMIVLRGLGRQNWLNSINDGGVAVGSALVQWEGFVAIVATETGGVFDLNTLIDPDSGWCLDGAAAINNHGQIVGGGVLIGQEFAYRLDPIPPKFTVAAAGTNVVVSWNPAWPGIVLESANSLPGANWQSVATGGTNVVIVPVDGSGRFFRLNLDALRGWCCAPPAPLPPNRPPLVSARVESVRLNAGPILDGSTTLLFTSPDGVRAPIVLNGQAYDPDGDPLTMEWGEMKDGEFQVFARTGVVTNLFDRFGPYELQFRASDGTFAATNVVLMEILTAPSVVTTLLTFLDASPHTRPEAKKFLGYLNGALREFQGDDYPAATDFLTLALDWAYTEPVSDDWSEHGATVWLLQQLVDAITNPSGVL